MAQVGVYLTDEVFLYRVDDVLVTSAGAMVDLEDCYGLDVVRVPLKDLRARRLRAVTPTRAGTERTRQFAVTTTCLTSAM